MHNSQNRFGIFTEKSNREIAKLCSIPSKHTKTILKKELAEAEARREAAKTKKERHLAHRKALLTKGRDLWSDDSFLSDQKLPSPKRVDFSDTAQSTDHETLLVLDEMEPPRRKRAPLVVESEQTFFAEEVALTPR